MLCHFEHVQTNNCTHRYPLLITFTFLRWLVEIVPSASVLFVLRKLPTKRGITQHHPTLGQSGSPQYVISNCSATLCEQKCRLSDTDEP
ncbi:Os09g0131400 [Oryza sativa Japonica Group]|uniref:Os09g0131400 protein n=1 Tax=Oryza sativa subsp. japonica TaxID=39947 RepID=A0A0P0XJ10_ORYSJ|nr:hypothetical protein EE612_046163 [Oryza sativa]KAB8109744.1 hypothetical protein EE612_046163 [Oryza sativa]KAF2915194.1 hypothetical protein DAI22_09g012700 [Oryza sativa Japonica Group]BAT06948.1 Os09g0131400 [Oryza sativa Japonica Group]